MRPVRQTTLNEFLVSLGGMTASRVSSVSLARDERKRENEVSKGWFDRDEHAQLITSARGKRISSS